MREIPSIADLIATPEKWCKGPEALDSSGKPALADDQTACAFCLFGALVRLFPSDARQYCDVLADNAVMDACQELFGTPVYIAFNDDPTTTHADVLRVARRADELIRERLEAAP